MSKFKVGDRVRRVKGPTEDSPVGHEVDYVEGSMNTLTRVVWYVNSRGSTVWSGEENWEIVDGPVRTVTRKEIVPGDFDKVTVCGQVNIPDCNAPWGAAARGVALKVDNVFTAHELSAAIATLTTIRDALDEAA